MRILIPKTKRHKKHPRTLGHTQSSRATTRTLRPPPCSPVCRGQTTLHTDYQLVEKLLVRTQLMGDGVWEGHCPNAYALRSTHHTWNERRRKYELDLFTGREGDLLVSLSNLFPRNEVPRVDVPRDPPSPNCTLRKCDHSM